MTFEIREATDRDTAELARVMALANPREPSAPDILAYEFAQLRGSELNIHLGRWLAIDGEEVVGVAMAMQFSGTYDPDYDHVTVMVRPEYQRRGVGTALADTLATHLKERGARRLSAFAYEDEPPALAFLGQRGFRETMRLYDNLLDLTIFDPGRWEQAAPLPEGVRLLTLHDLHQEVGREKAVRAYYECWAQLRLDVPRTMPAAPVPPDEFQRRRYENPEFLPEGVFLAVTSAGEIVGISELYRDSGDPFRLRNGLTGTRREWRRKGLALALKLAGVRLAQQLGIKAILTSNADTNAPMLALNERLGFIPQPAMIQFLCEKP